MAFQPHSVSSLCARRWRLSLHHWRGGGLGRSLISLTFLFTFKRDFIARRVQSSHQGRMLWLIRPQVPTFNYPPLAAAIPRPVMRSRSSRWSTGNRVNLTSASTLLPSRAPLPTGSGHWMQGKAAKHAEKGPQIPI